MDSHSGNTTLLVTGGRTDSALSSIPCEEQHDVCSSVARMLLVVGDAHEEVVVELGASPPRGGVGPAHIVRRRGGSAANVAALAADAHAAARYAGQVGLDHAGDFLIEDLEESGVDVCITRQGRTGTAVIVRSGATTTRIVDRATATQCTGFKSAVLDDVTLIHLPASAFSVEPLATAVEDLLGEAIERGIPITIDAADPETIDEIGAGEMRSLIAQLRPLAFFCNRAESVHLGLHGREPMAGALYTVVTSGPRPALLLSANSAVSFPVPPVAGIVDQDGAGDGFVTGFLLAHLGGQAPATCMRAGHLLASRVLRHAGPRLSIVQAVAKETSVSASTTS